MLLLNKFREQLEKYSDKVALEMGNKHLTWKEVDTLSDQIAVTLKNTYKIQKDSCIPVYMESSFEMIIVLLGIFKVGAYYLPIHRDFPLTRKLDLIKESQSSIVILDKNISTDNIKKIFWENLSNNKHTKNTKFDEEHGKFAYRIYTSGSTGKPKGVNVTQKNLEYILENLDSKFSVTPDDASILTTPFSFDVSVSELFSWIYGGGRLIIPNIKDNKMLLKYLPKEIIQHQVTHLALSPAVLSVLLQITDSDTKIKLNHYLKYVMVAGEEFPVKLANYAKKVLPDVRIFNLYGPTEGTVYATSYEIKEKCLNSVPIGKPLSNAKIVKKDPSKKISELIILGEGVAWGYWNNPQKTKEKFIKVNGQKGYLTGDLGEIDSHGNIIYHGRIDDQIQINGIRVELNEITTNVDKIDAVSKSYVLYKNRKLILFYTLNYPISQSIISKDLKQLLPSYMVPKRLVLLEKFPTNVNGKIDKNALIQLLRNDENVANATPENAEKIIKQTISKCLNIPSSIISNNTNIYTEIGMDSLASIEIIIELEKVMKQDIPLEILEKNPTVSDLSRALFNKSKEKFMDTRLSEMVRDKLNSQVKTFSRFRKSKAIKVVSLGHYQLNYLSSGFTSSISICLPVSDYKMQKMFRKKLAFLLENLDIFQTTIKREKNSFYQNMNWKYLKLSNILCK